MTSASTGTALVAPPERCTLCGGRHQSHLQADGRRALPVAEVAVHLNTSKAKVYEAIRERRLLKAPNRGPRQTAVLERNVVNFLENRPQEAAEKEFDRG